MKAPLQPPSSNVARWGLALVVAGTFLAFSLGLNDSFGLPKLLALACGACLAWAALAAGSRQRVTFRATRLDLPIAGMALAYVLSLCASPDPFVGIVGKYSIHAYGFAAFALCAAVYFAVAWSQEPENPRFLLSAALIAGAVAGAYAILQGLGLEVFPELVRRAGALRAGSTQGDPVPLGACLLMVMPLAMHRSATPLGWVSAALACGGLLFTFSRGAWLGAAAGLAFYAAASNRLRLDLLSPRLRWTLGLGAAAALAAALAAVGLFRPVRASDSARIELWRLTPGMVRENPWLGSGPDTFQTVLRKHRTEGLVRILGTRGSQVTAHNDFLQVLCTMGIAGLAAYLWLLYGAAAAVLDGLRVREQRSLAAAVGGLLLGLFVQAKFNPVPLAAMALASVCLGLLARGPARSATGVAILKAALFLFCGAAIAGVLRLSAADRSFHQGRVLESAHRLEGAIQAYREAVRLNPYEFFYRLTFSRALHSSAQAGRDPGRRIQLLEEAARLGEEAIARRPAEVEGYLLLGTYLMSLKLAGGQDRLAQAQNALDRAAAMDPLFLPLLENRWKLAEMRGLREEAKQRKAELERATLTH